MTFCPTSAACSTQSSEWATRGLCKERARLWSPGPARRQIVCKVLKVSEPQFLHLYNGNPNAYKWMVMCLSRVNA